MSSTLVVGDIHNKIWILNHIFEFTMGSGEHYADQFDKIIFLGDYVDDWNSPPVASHNALSRLIELKNKFPEQIVLLMGNHCLSEWLGGRFKCSGFNEYTHSLIKDLYSENEGLFDIAYWDGDFLYSHAGFTNQWIKDLDLPSTPKELVETVNDALHYRYTNQRRNGIFSALAQAGSGRGGMGTPSPVWADKRELEANPLPFVNQIVGHTPVKTVTSHEFKNGDGSRNTLWFCDTFSTYKLPLVEATLPIGDSSVLIVDKSGGQMDTWIDNFIVEES